MREIGLAVASPLCTHVTSVETCNTQREICAAYPLILDRQPPTVIGSTAVNDQRVQQEYTRSAVFFSLH